MIYIIGISGKGGSGKDTLAAYLIDKLTREGQHAKRVAFADKVKEFGKTYFANCDPVLKDPTSRLILQGVGNMFREEIGQDFWITKVKETIVEDLKSVPQDVNSFYFITDVRYRNEADILTSPSKFFLELGDLDTVAIRLTGRTALSGVAAEHISETDLDGYLFPYNYTNVGSVEDLYDFGDDFIKRFVND